MTDGGGGLASPDPAARARAVLGRCAAHGFALAGIAEARPSSHAESFRAWIAAGKQGAMAYLAEELERRLDPRALVPGAASVLCVADRYSDGRPDRRVPWEGSVARYARGEDYHEVIRARLESLAEELRRAHPGERFRVCVDTAPLLEREHAERAGLGRVGKHTLLIGAGGAGTWLLLGCLVSTLPLAAVRADGLPPGAAASDPCGACTACIDACPTGAIRPWSVDGRTCISALTIEQPGGIPGELAARMSGWLFGCDLCQEACPHSQPTRRSRALGIHEAYRPHLPAQLPLAEVLGWTAADLERMRFNAVLRRADLSMWRRNAALAAHGALRSPEVPPDVRAALREALLKVAADRSAAPEARSAASWAIGSS